MKAHKDAKCNKSCFLWKITIKARNSLTSLLQKNKQAINYKLQLNKILKFRNKAHWKNILQAQINARYN
jgi:hypothetical protein